MSTLSNRVEIQEEEEGKRREKRSEERAGNAHPPDTSAFSNIWKIAIERLLSKALAFYMVILLVNKVL